MSVPQETPKTQAGRAYRRHPTHAAPVSLEARFISATQSQRLAIEDALRFLAVWSVKAVSGAREPPSSS